MMKTLDRYAPVAVILNMVCYVGSAFVELYNAHLKHVRYGGDDTH